MSISIAGRTVKKDDSLYHRSFDAWGKITGFDPSGSALFVITGPYGKRELMVQDGGIVNDRRQLYWHEPIDLDVPRSDVSAIQRIVDVVKGELA